MAKFGTNGLIKRRKKKETSPIFTSQNQLDWIQKKNNR